MVAHAREITAVPTVNTPATSTGRAPNRSMAHPTTGDRTIDANAPALTAPAIRVRDQPSSWDMGYMNTVNVVMAGAILAKTAVPEAPATTQP